MIAKLARSGDPAAVEAFQMEGRYLGQALAACTIKGKVIAIGNGTKDEEMVVKPDDTVLYGKYAGTEIELDGEKYLIMKQSDILAIL